MFLFEVGNKAGYALGGGFLWSQSRSTRRPKIHSLVPKKTPNGNRQMTKLKSLQMYAQKPMCDFAMNPSTCKGSVSRLPLCDKPFLVLYVGDDASGLD